MLLQYFTTIMLFGLSQNIRAAEIANIAIPDKKISLILTTFDQSLKTLPLNKMVPLIVDVQKTLETNPELKIKLIGFDAQMPEHSHGMVVLPKITSLNESQWFAKLCVINMIGRRFDKFTSYIYN